MSISFRFCISYAQYVCKHMHPREKGKKKKRHKGKKCAFAFFIQCARLSFLKSSETPGYFHGASLKRSIFGMFLKDASQVGMLRLAPRTRRVIVISSCADTSRGLGCPGLSPARRYASRTGLRAFSGSRRSPKIASCYLALNCSPQKGGCRGMGPVTPLVLSAARRPAA